MLVISYVSRELADRCTKLEVAQQWLSPTVAQALVDLIADAEALDNALELIEFYGAEVSADDCLSVAFSPDFRAMLKPAGNRLPRAGEALVWKRVRRLMLVDVQGP